MEKIWQKLYVKRVPQAIDFDEITLPEALTRTASRFPDRPALVFQGTIVTYRELEDMVSRFTGALMAMGVKPGGKVSLVMPNLVQTVVAIYGTLRAGAIVVTHNPRNDDMQLEFQINNAGSEIVVCLDVSCAQDDQRQETDRSEEDNLVPYPRLSSVPREKTLPSGEKRATPQNTGGERCL